MSAPPPPPDAALARGLLARQHPDLAGLPLAFAGAGQDNALFRLGPALCVRLPRRQAAADLLRNEQAWLPLVAGLAPLPVPAPVRLGRPDPGFPWPWSVVPWFDGRPADLRRPNPAQAAVLGRFLRALHVAPPDGFPRNPHRGVPLAEKAAAMAPRLERLGRSLGAGPASAVAAVWGDALAAPAERRPRVVHGDLHPGNVVVAGGAIAAVVDWGDLCAGDPAVDLAAAWMLFPDPAARNACLAAYGPVSAPDRRRAMGWAAYIGAALLDGEPAADPRPARLGRRILSGLAAAAD